MVDIKQLIKQLRPHKTRFDLIRVGSPNDGGYLIPNDLKDIVACFSPGVDVNASFEVNLLGKYNIPSHLADFSVNHPPIGFAAKSFTKKYLGNTNNDTYMTLDSWLSSYPEEGDLLLQMDIEGGEYETLLNTSEDTLRKFRIIVLEVHDTHRWTEPEFYNTINTIFSKILSDFHVVHVHPNNCCPLHILQNIPVPHVFELTFLRKDRSESLGLVDQLPHPLDRKNLPFKPDLLLPSAWLQL